MDALAHNAAVARVILANKGHTVRNTFLDEAPVARGRPRSLPAAWSDGGDTAATGAGRKRVFLEHPWVPNFGHWMEELSMSSSDDAAVLYARATAVMGCPVLLGRRGVCLPRAGRLGDLLPRLDTVVLQAR